MIKVKESKMTIAVIFVSILITLFIKSSFIDYKYADYLTFLQVWIQDIREGGGFSSLKSPFYNYTPMYMYLLVLVEKTESLFNISSLYLIKAISFLFEYILAFFVGRLAYLYKKKQYLLWLPFIVIPLAPSLFINSAFMSQCDAIYVSFIVGSLFFLFTKRQLLAMLFLGIAFAFKLQTALILPLYFVYMLRGHIKWYYFSILPIVYILSILPTWCVGRSFVDLLTIYVAQAGYNASLVGNFPNIYIWFNEYFMAFYTVLQKSKLIGAAFVAVLILLAGWELRKDKYKMTLECWLSLALLGAVVCPFFLPGVLDRYMYLGDTLAILYAIVNIRKTPLALAIIFVSFYSCARSIYGYSSDKELTQSYFFIYNMIFIPWKAVSILYMGIIAYTFYDFVKVLNASKNKEEFISQSLTE